jgi:hypothetical protein
MALIPADEGKKLFTSKEARNIRSKFSISEVCSGEQ